MSQRRTSIRSRMAWSTPDRIEVQGYDLCQDLLGHVNLGDMAFLELMGRLPDNRESVVFNGILVTLVEHGLTPMAIASRLTHMGAPESLQGAVAAGLLGLGSRFAGTAEGAARLLSSSLATNPEKDIDSLAEEIVQQARKDRQHLPGLGHNLHKPVDPRAERLFEIAEEQGFSSRPVALIRALSSVASRVYGRELPVNATGAMGALCCEMGLDWRLARGIAVMGRAVGLVGHLAEEMRAPIAHEIWLRADEEAQEHYVAGGGDDANS